MQLQPQYDDLSLYLQSDAIIDFQGADGLAIRQLAAEIAASAADSLDFIRKAFEWVRDEIPHSADIGGSVVTCRASEVLRYKEGICYAKAHLLAALLRCREIPAGFCYQRLILDDDTAPDLILHGLTAVYVAEIGRWIRLDARGNKKDVQAQFSLITEKLAFPVRPEKGEEDIPVIFARPDANVISCLQKYNSVAELFANLPCELAGSVQR